ncbi:egl nine homolog 3 [Contarinia nasturtii]|uniref:egl nine homolog 3 n=1 Tax=Contarinia nasturtii TaxID=265458 RepID=UPI0012D491EA|nr:egl nine homolog 3 [Contarinia nasturtii]XP_031634045.1 egl nine homolog 3 [Contarinia nasturtii]XP_031634046.1 egl nine homolog 3 [Contarinia nasturtii]
MTDENSMPPSITSTTGFIGECNTSGVSSSTEQFIICCKVCGSLNGLRRCSRCKSVYYCSQVHQQVDWRVHKIECKKFATNLASKSNSTMTVETQQNHDRLLGKNGVTNTVNGVPSTNANGVLKKSTNAQQKDEQYKRLTENTMQVNVNLMENSLASSELRYDSLCKQIIRDMNMYGMCVVDDFLGMNYGLGILNEVHGLYAAGVFQNGQVASNTVDADVKTIRGDKITWVKGTEQHCQSIGFLINQIDTVVISANRMKDNGLLGEYKIRERTKAMVACYPPTGSHYILHVDNPNRDGRVITAIYYLNLHWDALRSGGSLRIFPEHGMGVADIEPKFDRIIFFWSDRRNPHEVQPSHRTRYAITVWYFDADEREMALSQYKN